MNDESGCCTVLCRLVGVRRGNSEHGYETCEGNPISKEGRIWIHKQVGGKVRIAMRMDDEGRGVYCNAVGIWESGRRDVQRDVSLWTPRGGTGFQEAIGLRATNTSIMIHCAYLRWGRHYILPSNGLLSSEIGNGWGLCLRNAIWCIWCRNYGPLGRQMREAWQVMLSSKKELTY